MIVLEKVSRENVEDAVNKIFNNNVDHTKINITVLIQSLIEEFSTQHGKLSPEQGNKLGEVIFFHPDVLSQLEQSEHDLEKEDISNFDEYLKFKNEVLNERT